MTQQLLYSINDSNDIKDVYKSFEEYNADKKRKILIVFDDMMIMNLRRERQSLKQKSLTCPKTIISLAKTS